ncbi:Hsp20/alpha crystallin family protein [Candidatus Saccharibacteria bacterium]|jgi:HSP20 family protein|nr:Hsp20/alpha crystallin family protein [Candidatus Saccharibacteria bacterium]HOR57760.1 Hsp20/alpha crystallin family protein [bacterium]HPW48354.1 Hsp20/alpha crystallin family protein [Candidatus Saccharibacteria bacterium]
MAIVKWDPFRGLDNFFEDDLSILPFGRNLPSDLSVDVYEDGSNVVAEMHVAGMDPKKLDVTVEDNYLRVVGCKEEAKEDKSKSYYYKEIRRGSFERAVRLPAPVKEQNAKATYENGVLKVIIPKEVADKKHKKVEIEIKKK